MSQKKTVKGVGWDVAALGNGLYFFIYQFTQSCNSTMLLSMNLMTV